MADTLTPTVFFGWKADTGLTAFTGEWSGTNPAKMPAYILIPFAVFFGCCVAQFWFMKRVRDTLIERHPEAFLAIEKSSIFPMQGLWRFTQKGRYKALNDPELNTHVRNLKRLYA